MTPEQKERIRELFLAACEKDPRQRIEFLRRACADDDLVRREVESLLASDDEADTFLQTPALGETFARAHPESLLPKAAAAPAGGSSADIGIDRAPSGAYPERIGQYRILDVLGEGGMGVVYRAEQVSPRRAVALKVIRAGAESREMLKRFEHEGQVLGWLQHPGIAQIFEAGTADTGQGLQPFFAMEFVRGQPLTSYAAAQELTLAQRLELIAKVCDAVHHAHQKGVIHRDLKPGNILVDDSGQPKVLDFGVARVTDADIRTTTLQTDVGQLVGTLAYMSPEQVAGDSRQLDTRSDVYALGVLLYELLAGRVPFDVSQQTIPQAARMIAEEEPTSLSSINRVFRGDIETIVAKALDKDKERRYQSAAALASDIRRYLSDEPISARPASTIYQLRKFARRNRALVGGVLATFVVLLMGVAGTSYGLIQAVAQRRDAESERNRALVAERVAEQRQADAEQQAAIAQAANNFLHEVLSLASPAKAMGRQVTVREAVDMAAADVSAFTAGQPETEAAVRAAVGRTYHSLGHFDLAAEQLKLALEIRRRELGPEHPDTLSSMRKLAGALNDLGRAEEAISLLRKGIETQRRILGEAHPDTIDSCSALAWFLFGDGRAAEAEPLFRQVLEGFRMIDGPEAPTTLKAMTNLAAVLIKQGRVAEAEPLITEAAAALPQVLDPRHPDTLYILGIHAWYLYAADRCHEAEVLYRGIIRDATEVLGVDHPYRLFWLGKLGRCLLKLGRLDEAERLFIEALTAQRRVLADGHGYIVESTEGLARTLIAQRRFDQAEPLAAELYNVASARYAADHPLTADAVAVLIDLYDAWGKPEQAAEWRTKLPSTQPTDEATAHVNDEDNP